MINLTIESAFKIISKINIGYNDKINSHHTFLLFKSIKSFIENYPNVFNEPDTLQGIFNILVKNLEKIYDKEDIIDSYFNINDLTGFNEVYNAFDAYANNMDFYKKIKIYEKAIEQLQIFIQFGDINE